MRLFPHASCSCSSSGCAAPLWQGFWALPCRSPASWCSGVLLSPCWSEFPGNNAPSLPSLVGAVQMVAELGPTPRAWLWDGYGGCLLIAGRIHRPGDACGPWVPFVSFKKGVTEWWLRGRTISLYCGCPSPQMLNLLASGRGRAGKLKVSKLFLYLLGHSWQL